MATEAQHLKRGWPDARPRRALGPLLAVLALHLLALLGLMAAQRQPPRSSAAPASTGALLNLLPARPQRPSSLVTAPRPAAPVPARQPARLQEPLQSGPGEARSPAVTQAERPAEAVVARPADAASAPLPSLLDSEATRRAIRAATREPLLSERAASATQDAGRPTAQQRLGRDMAQAADGDCMKGEFAGGGMGLLSLPFWLAAEARGKCRR